MSSTNNFKDQFTKIKPALEAFTLRSADLLTELLGLRSIKFHMIESRVKRIDSFMDKINRHGKTYHNPLEEMPDLSGIRIIVFYNDDVDKVLNLIKEEFDVIDAVTEHKPEHYNADTFGYLSMHIIVRLSKIRASLPEWKAYNTFHVEIQVRTVLQHSWATISHALQYKKESDVPFKLQRRLYRLAGLFELADEEFVALRDAKIETKKEVKDALMKGDKSIPLDSAALREFLENWKILPDLTKYMMTLGYKFEQLDSDSEYIGHIVMLAEKLNIKTIGDLDKVLNYDPKPFLKAAIKEDRSWTVSDIFVLNLMIIKGCINNISTDDLVEMGAWHYDIAQRVIEAAKNTNE